MKLDYFKKYIPEKEVKDIRNKEVWVYTRVSSKDQQSNHSLGNQRQFAENFAKRKNYKIVNEFGNVYESAKDDFSRKEFSRLINEVKKSKNKPDAILIYKITRFSRSGGDAIQLINELIDKYNVHLIEVISGKDTTTPRGRHEIHETLLEAKREQLERLDYTIPGLISHLNEGKWLGVAPRGYTMYGRKVTDHKRIAGEQRIEINEEGKQLKKAWKWKLQELKDFEILDKLKNRGLIVTKQFLSGMWRKPFYCGVIVHKMLDKPVKGNWEGLVTVGDFKKINQKLEEKTNNGYKQSKYFESRPLQGHLYCSSCGSKMTGYRAKKEYDYYKCLNSKCNAKDINAENSKFKKGIHSLFESYLKEYTLDSAYISAFKKQMKLSIQMMENEKITDLDHIKKELDKIKINREKLEHRMTFESMDEDIYLKFKKDLELKEENFLKQKENCKNKISNLNKRVEESVSFAQNISKIWVSGDSRVKDGLQKLLFPKGLVINTEKRQYRTKKVNRFFSRTACFSNYYWSKYKKTAAQNELPSCLVAGVRLELTTFGL